MADKTRLRDATKRRNALMYLRSEELIHKHKPFTLSKKELWQTLCDEFFLSHPNSVGKILNDVKCSIRNGTYQTDFGCYV